MTFLQLAEKVLHEVGHPLSGREIWEQAIQSGYSSSVATKGQTPWATIEAQMFVNIRDKPDSVFGRTASKPKKFTLKVWTGEVSTQIALTTEDTQLRATEPKKQKAPSASGYLEKDLHSLLSHFAYYSLKSFTKTVNHSLSSKAEFGDWVHPDIVGCAFQFDGWQKEVTAFSKAISNITVKLFSFELKRKLSFANLRESFFQAVSNSSWANEGYLVAAEISDDEKFVEELRRLSTSFGIGIIKLDVADPESSERILPARMRDALDWDTIDKLALMNKDFREFLNRIQKDINSNEVYKEQYDSVISTEKLQDYFKRKVTHP